MAAEPEFKTYGYEYYHNGSWWNFEIQATSLDDAIARVKKLPLAKCIGTLEAVIPASTPGAGLCVRFLCWWKNRA